MIKRLCAAILGATLFLFALPALAAPVIIAAVASAGIGYGVAYMAGTLATYSFASVFFTSLALGAASMALAGKPKSLQGFQAEAQGRTTVVRSAVATRRIVYGTSPAISGPLLYAESTTAGASLYHHYVIPLAGHECQEITDVYFNDELVGTLDGSGNVTTGTFSGAARIKKHLGASDQVADADLVSESAGFWTSAHRLRGVTYIYVRLLITSGAYPNGIPNIKAVVKGKKLYDPRNPGSPTVYTWSDNWALCVRDYLASSYGLGCSDAEIDDTAIIAAANISDELVVTAAGSPQTEQKRYTCNGTVDLGDRPRDIMQRLLTAGAGSCNYCQGVYRVLAGAYTAPDSDDRITADWLAGGVKIRPRAPRQELFNSVGGTYCDPDKQGVATDFYPVSNATYQAQDGGIQIRKDIELPFTEDPLAAQRIAKQFLEKARQSFSLQATCNMKAFRLRVGQSVLVAKELTGDTADKTMVVFAWGFNERGTIDLQLQEDASASYDWVYTDATVLATPQTVPTSNDPPTFAWNTWDPAKKSTAVTLSNENLTVLTAAPDASSVKAILSQVGGGSPSITTKRYCEFTINDPSNVIVGLATAAADVETYGLGDDAESYGYWFNGNKKYNGTNTAYGDALVAGDVVSMLWDTDTGALSFWRNNADQGVAYTVAGTYFPACCVSNTGVIVANFGASAWAYTPPAGYTGWSV